MLFQSERLVCRKMTMEDAEQYHAWRNDLEVMQSTSPFLDTYTMEETRDFMQHVILGSASSKSYLLLLKESGKPIGIMSLIHIDLKNRNAECVLDIGDKDCWGQGYGSEAMRLLLDYAFLEMNLHRLGLRVFSFNQRAIRLYEKVGFTREGSARQSLFRGGSWHDVIYMGILQNEYVKKG
ncbi:GNAT family N-acetyltransferase [Paenibacillus ihbetae]|uniref:GNAT family N-acetyltransferase n=1 Tax=Paenibacillus ihbetae TaxID=1870820 RepID=A0ABX3JW04_9BACL|nr:GNAT family protein [Paenibacillus ihbetae]OOC60604.1 GNAT family N-acetyltransferase [Paenibacillus ihbetae]